MGTWDAGEATRTTGRRTAAGARRRASLLALSVPFAMALGCSRPQQAAPADSSFRVRNVVPAPDPRSGELPPLFLNQPITVYFSGPVDPLSVTPDTVRVTNADGLAVDGKLRAGAQSVTFEPLVPLQASLADGSFRPDSSYRLEVSGFPRVNAVRSAAGRVLERGFAREFRTVPRDGGAPDGTPLLPVGIGSERFEVRTDVPLEVAAESGVLRLHCTLPPFPPSVTPKAFRVVRLRGSSQAELELARVGIARTQPLLDPWPGCTLELTIGGEGSILPGDLVFVLLHDGGAAIRDYRRRPVHVPLPGYKSVTVHPGKWVRLVHEEFDRVTLTTEPGCLPFTTFDGQAVPAVQQAGSGRLGAFRPARSGVIDVDQPFDRGDGTLVRAADGTLDFFDVHVPAGVRLTLHSRGPLQVRAAADIVVDGRLLLDTPLGDAAPPVPAAGLAVPFEALIAGAGACLIAGGDIRIGGRIDHKGEPLAPGQQPLVLVCGGELHVDHVDGRVPPGSVLASPRGEVHGVALQPLVFRAELTPGLPPGAVTTVAAAWTPWYRLPPHHFGPIDFELQGRRGDLQVFVQTAPPDPIEPSRPLLAPDVIGAPQALPLAAPLDLPGGGHVRFLLRAEMRANGELPALDGLAVIGR